MEPQRHIVQQPEGEVSFLEWNGHASLPPLHFAHANGFNAFTYRSLLSPLSEHFRIRAWDARGHGMTKLPADPSRHESWHIYRDDLVRFLEDYAAEAGAPVLLAGHSMGATMSLLAAAARPDIVSGLVLIDPVLLPRYAYWVLRLYRLFGLKSGPAALAENTARRRSVFADRPTTVSNYKGRGAFRTWPEEIIADYVEGGTRDLPDGQVELTCSPAWEAQNFRAHIGDIWAAIGELRVPLTLIYAGGSSIYSGSASTCRNPGPRRLALQDPKATALRIGEATHFLPMEFPDACRREIVALQNRIEGKVRVPF